MVAAEFADLGIPVVAVLGNHDYQCDSEQQLARVGVHSSGA